MLRTLLSLSLTVLALGALPASADVYKYKDEHGNVQYTDKPQTLPAERLNVQSQKTDTVAVQARREADMKRMEEASAARKAWISSDCSTTSSRKRRFSSSSDRSRRSPCILTVRYLAFHR